LRAKLPHRQPRQLGGAFGAQQPIVAIDAAKHAVLSNQAGQGVHHFCANVENGRL